MCAGKSLNKEVGALKPLLDEMIARRGLSPEADIRTYTMAEVSAEFGITPLAVRGLAKRRGITKSSPGKGYHWAFTRADIERMRIRGPSCKTKKPKE